MADLQGATNHPGFPNAAESTYREYWNHYYNQRKSTGTEGQRGSRTAVEKEHRHPKSMDTLRWSMARESQVALGSGHSYDVFLQWWVNPSECQWHVGLRSAVQKTSGGAVHFQNYDKGVSQFDMPMLTISFQSGIIIPGGYFHINHIDPDITMPHGIGNFYDFLDLLDQPNQYQGKPNYVNIFYVSPVHGAKGIWLRGFFTDEGTQWTDTADQPDTITYWTATFMVCTANQPLNRLRLGYQAPLLNQPRQGKF